MGFLNCIVSHEETEHKLWSHLPTLDGAPEDSKWAFLDNLATWLEGCQLPPRQRLDSASTAPRQRAWAGFTIEIWEPQW